MSKDRKSFLLHIDSLDILEDLTEKESGELFNAIRRYHLGEEVTLQGVVKIAFSPFRNQFKRDIEKYELTCKRRAEAGSKGGKQKVANVANASKCKQEVANVAESKNKSDSKNDSKSKSDNDSKNFKTLVAFAPVDSEFESFWTMYDKKEGRHKCELKFKKLSNADRHALFNALNSYIKSTPDKQYRKNPLTWLNGKHWNDEITPSVNQSPDLSSTNWAGDKVFDPTYLES